MRRFLKVFAPILVLALVLVACVTISVNPTTGDVTVTACDYNGFPLEGAQVQLGGTVMTVGADGTVTFMGADLPYDLAVLDDIANEVRVFFGLSALTPGIVMPNSNTNSANVNSSQVFGQFNNDFSSSPVAHLVGATVNDRPGFQQLAPSSYSIDAKWSVEDGLTANALLYGFAPQYEFSTDPDIFSNPGTVLSFRGGLATTTLTDGGSANEDIDLADYVQGSLSGTVGTVPGFDLQGRSFGLRAGTILMTNGVNIQIQSDFGIGVPLPGTFSYPSQQPPSGWTFGYWNENYFFNNSTLEEIVTTRTNLAFDASGVSVSPAFTTVPDVSGITNGSSFGVGTEINIGNHGIDTVEVFLHPLFNTPLLNIHLFADGNSFPNNNVEVPDLSPLGISLPSGEDYSLSLRRYSWTLETMASKLAGVPRC